MEANRAHQVSNTSPGWRHFAPTGTPAEIVKKIKDGTKQAVESPDVRAKLDNLGMDVRTGTSDELHKLLNSDIEKWAKWVEQENIKLEP